MDVVILAAGKGTRMRSALPKVLQRLAGRPMLAHVLATARRLDVSRICVVYGHGGEVVREALQAPDIVWARQEPQLGTGHAVAQALPQLDGGAPVMVLYGDVPLIGEATLRRLRAAAGERSLALLTIELEDPTGYGRIVRNDEGAVQCIVEQKDATPEQLRINEINTGILMAPYERLVDWLARVGNDNAQGEYYLTDIIALAVAEGTPVVTVTPDAVGETLGVNNRGQLAELERLHQRNQAERLMNDGVTLIDPGRFDLRGELVCGQDVEIDVNCVFEGRVELGDNVRIGPNCVIRDAVIGAGTRIAPFSHIEDTTMGAACVIGPYARTRPGTRLGADVHVGNFVEIKNSHIQDHSKANHLAYVGDADVGQRVNIGAGTITCNYDGANKFRTIIEDDVFIGSDTQLVAPVRVGRGATLGAGTTLTKDAPPEQLTVSRARQLAIPGWKRPIKIKK
ncbi:MAG TPA: bifunctional UDP-N-acetylglucosamine diphosphorylase/glucosamine-1-phosphate N-acetyltransferase GlmU [Rhodocyclaceae bacterium]|nr:bifunctional UDP-N-acetylglucosamine diphosphorylase/glucosamine-1-phosphate N-acetyltransferase GlmU [Rhodocyclaceae bacterium]